MAQGKPVPLAYGLIRNRLAGDYRREFETITIKENQPQATRKPL
ncbi:hypothetical protein N220_05485 [Mannheimia haemolytica USMARC_2286]|nr:hypothetical protein N220_05485 [Mannheimia haemolytica USMARC_2286]